ncbi:hypothetical protein [Nocardioides daejeonensis]|uniref:hypothetical protein n=1 Tax=Nocardioides daejeonensis TaxID=1046556 RepID=UPI000D744C49|nr:hypothetical protein [Nocardioides daejeonensis]
MTSADDLARAVGLSDGSLAGLGGLQAEHLQALTTLAQTAIDREDALVQESLEAALAALPRPLRGRARALLLEES